MDSCVLFPIFIGLTINWVVQMYRVFNTRESDFRQPTDRVLWFIVVALVPLGAVVYVLWGDNFRQEAGRRRLFEEIISRDEEQPPAPETSTEDT